MLTPKRDSGKFYFSLLPAALLIANVSWGEGSRGDFSGSGLSSDMERKRLDAALNRLVSPSMDGASSPKDYSGPVASYEAARLIQAEAIPCKDKECFNKIIDSHVGDAGLAYREAVKALNDPIATKIIQDTCSRVPFPQAAYCYALTVEVLKNGETKAENPVVQQLITRTCVNQPESCKDNVVKRVAFNARHAAGHMQTFANAFLSISVLSRLCEKGEEDVFENYLKENPDSRRDKSDGDLYGHGDQACNSAQLKSRTLTAAGISRPQMIARAPAPRPTDPGKPKPTDPDLSAIVRSFDLSGQRIAGEHGAYDVGESIFSLTEHRLRLHKNPGIEDVSIAAKILELASTNPTKLSDSQRAALQKLRLQAPADVPNAQ